ncbi:cyclopropane fatty acyl phospholipid synthase [Flavobacterium praedii]|uniref:cyclopropane fatty acyl phospholipid synthase n=1 Tax=Flavobacterium praedii TaxID=3002900 RepID=UPI002481B8F7|nr:cyclopropane fatty acyl phospholipid synthase [Flavobacterium praedii]
MNINKVLIERLLSEAGITIDGKESFDIRIKNSKFYERVLRDGSIGLGESYMEGWWECDALDDFFCQLFLKQIEKKFSDNFSLKLQIFKTKLFNLQTKSKSQCAIESHYDIGNDLYSKMLDPLMMYSCGYWKNATTLKEAQEQKLKLICEKLHLKPGQKVLDIGCGWGGFAYYAAKNYKVNVVGITISKEQHELAKKRCNGLNVEIRFQDYRDIDEQFDRIVSIGMLEHVGHKNYTTFMETINKNLNDTGICLLHFIGGNETNLALDSWINKYIFPNGLIPSLAQIGKAMENQLIIEDLHNIGIHYDKTLMAWYMNFKNSWNEIKENYNNTFYLKWIFYLMSSAASFRSRRLSLWQIVIRKPGLLVEYESVRF